MRWWMVAALIGAWWLWRRRCAWARGLLPGQAAGKAFSFLPLQQRQIISRMILDRRLKVSPDGWPDPHGSHVKSPEETAALQAWLRYRACVN